jgi:hypothetical protein
MAFQVHCHSLNFKTALLLELGADKTYTFEFGACIKDLLVNSDIVPS